MLQDTLEEEEEDAPTFTRLTASPACTCLQPRAAAAALPLSLGSRIASFRDEMPTCVRSHQWHYARLPNRRTQLVDQALRQRYQWNPRRRNGTHTSNSTYLTTTHACESPSLPHTHTHHAGSWKNIANHLVSWLPQAYSWHPRPTPRHRSQGTRSLAPLPTTRSLG